MAFRLINLRLIAMIQLLIMVVLALPAYSYDSDPEHDKQTICGHLETGAAGQDSCPCCPEDEEGGSDNCSACSHCSYWTPPLSLPLYKYLPSVGTLTVLESSRELADVDIPIFVPPQNLV